MFRSAITRSRLASRSVAASAQRKLSGSPLEADSGALATHAHHMMSASLLVLTPAYFMVPSSYTDGFFDKAFGLLFTANISAHSWVGLNYVATDYVPKVSKKLLGPARIFNVGLIAVTFLGLSRITFSSKGGIKGVVKGLWNPPEKK
jgi:succinate dehydrogenase hydrophobic anchor subunit